MSKHRRERPERWSLVIHADTSAPRPRLRRILLVASAALLVAALASPGLALRCSLAAIGLALLVYTRRRRPPAPRPSGVAIVADVEGLSRVSPEGTKPLVRWDAPFGVTLLATYGRPHALLAFTTPSHTRYVPTRIDTRTDDDDELLARIAVLADLDFIDGAAHEAALSSYDAAAVVRHAERRDGRALGRVFLTDGRGAPIALALDQATLSIASRSFDLTSHLEWRALMFHESTGQASALYQGTWIRQNGAEVVLIAPMPASIVPREPNAQRSAVGHVGHALTRHLQLLQSPVEPPPARDVRVAIDRPFMLAIRRALDEAPLASRVAPPIAKASPRSAGRGSLA